MTRRDDLRRRELGRRRVIGSRSRRASARAAAAACGKVSGRYVVAAVAGSGAAAVGGRSAVAGGRRCGAGVLLRQRQRRWETQRAGARRCRCGGGRLWVDCASDDGSGNDITCTRKTRRDKLAAHTQDGWIGRGKNSCNENGLLDTRTQLSVANINLPKWSILVTI